MSDKKMDTAYEYGKIAKERTLWIIRPVAIVCIVAWVVHPNTSLASNVETNILLGFLFGALLGGFIYREQLQEFWTIRLRGKDAHNRIPDEYYLGKVKEVLFKK